MSYFDDLRARLLQANAAAVGAVGGATVGALAAAIADRSPLVGSMLGLVGGTVAMAAAYRPGWLKPEPEPEGETEQAALSAGDLEYHTQTLDYARPPAERVTTQFVGAWPRAYVGTAAHAIYIAALLGANRICPGHRWLVEYSTSWPEVMAEQRRWWIGC